MATDGRVNVRITGGSDPLTFIRAIVGAWDCCGTCAGEATYPEQTPNPYAEESDRG